jgi:hypothetical protein
MATSATRLLMSSSALFLAALGVSASFLPREILGHVGSPVGWFAELVIQLAGAGFIAFAVLNWAARGNMIGGIYGRPIALGNFAHFAIGAITLIKAGSSLRGSALLLAVAAGYAVFAVWFGYTVFGRGPTKP